MSDDLQFEKALEKLEKIVEELESGDVPLEDALKKFEQGVKLSRNCQSKLSQAEKKIAVLTKTLDGKIVKEDFDPDVKEQRAAGAKKRGKKSAADEEDGDGDFLL